MRTRALSRFTRLMARVTTVAAMSITAASVATVTTGSLPAGASTNWSMATLLDGDQVQLVTDGTYYYVSDMGPFNVNGGHFVYKYDNTGTLLATVDTGTDSNPGGMAISNGYLYVGLLGTGGTGGIEKIDLSNFTGTNFALPTGVSPGSLTADGNGNLWITTAFPVNQAVELDPSNMATLNTVTISACQGWLTLKANATSVWGTCALDNVVFEFPLSGLPNPTVTTLDYTGFSAPNDITFSGTTAYVGGADYSVNKGVYVAYNTVTLQQTQVVHCTTCGGLFSVTVDGSDIWMSAISSSYSEKVDSNGNVIDTIDNGLNGSTQILPVGNNVWQATAGGLYIFSPQASTPASITVTSSAPTDATVGGQYYLPTATSTSGDAVVITADPSSSAVCTVSEVDGSLVVNFIGAGTCVLNFNDPGNGSSYSAATQAQQSFLVSAPMTGSTRSAVYFGTDSWRLSAGAQRALRTFAAAVATAGVHRVHVTGYADARGSRSYNVYLSGQRAKAVASFLRLYFAAHDYSVTVMAHAGGIKHTAKIARARTVIATA